MPQLHKHFNVVRHEETRKSKMKFYNLYIHFENSSDTYKAVTEILGLTPADNGPSKFTSNLHDTWWYQITERDDDKAYDFIP